MDYEERKNIITREELVKSTELYSLEKEEVKEKFAGTLRNIEIINWIVTTIGLMGIIKTILTLSIEKSPILLIPILITIVIIFVLFKMNKKLYESNLEYKNNKKKVDILYFIILFLIIFIPLGISEILLSNFFQIIILSSLLISILCIIFLIFWILFNAKERHGLKGLERYKEIYKKILILELTEEVGIDNVDNWYKSQFKDLYDEEGKKKKGKIYFYLPKDETKSMESLNLKKYKEDLKDVLLGLKLSGMIDEKSFDFLVNESKDNEPWTNLSNYYLVNFNEGKVESLKKIVKVEEFIVY